MRHWGRDREYPKKSRVKFLKANGNAKIGATTKIKYKIQNGTTIVWYEYLQPSFASTRKLGFFYCFQIFFTI